MRNINNLNTKGQTDVENDSSGMSSGANEKIFNSASAEVIRDESRWDAFQLMGDTNGEEMQHKATAPRNSVNIKGAMKRGEAFVNTRLRRLGGKVTAVYGYSASRAA